MERNDKLHRSTTIVNSQELCSRCNIRLNEAVREYRMAFIELYKT